MENARGLLVVVCAPSGAGKTTICKGYMDIDSTSRYSVSLTTREPRINEMDGVDYRFVDSDTFNRAVEKDEMVEYEKVHDWFYGTPKSELEDALSAGIVLLIDIDVKGGLAIKKKYPDETLSIFIKPQSEMELRKRLRLRGADSESKIDRRLERYEMELSFIDEFDKVIINKNLDDALNEFIEALSIKRRQN